MGVFAYNNRVNGVGKFTAVTGTFSNVLTHMAGIQVPAPYTSVTPSGGTIEFDWQARDSAGSADAFDVDVLALLGHTLPSGATVEFLDGSTSLASVTLTSTSPANTVAALSSSVNLDTVTVKVTSAGSDEINIGGLWASSSFVHATNSGWRSQVQDTSRVGMAGLTKWVNRRQRGRLISGRFDLLTESEAFTGTGNLDEIFVDIGDSKPVIFIRGTSDRNEIDRLHVYGTLSEPGVVGHLEADLYYATFDVEEMR